MNLTLIRSAVFMLLNCVALNVEAQPASVVGATFEPTTQTLSSLADGNTWVGYRVPLVAGAGSVCCYDRDRTAGCRLVGINNYWHGRGFDDARAPGQHLLVFLAPASSRAGRRVHAYDSACPIAADGLRIRWLGDVAPADSVATLGPWARDTDRDSSALAAIAHHAGDGATSFLSNIARDGGLPDKNRSSAAFWLGAERGSDGYAVLASLLDSVDRPSLRTDLATALAQSDVPEALDRLIALARTDRSAKVRGEGLFWLAQTANARVPRVLMEAAEQDPEVEVKKRAVFAIAQLPTARGVPLLIDVAQNHTSVAVRERAIFWLGQTGDTKALDFIVSLLETR